MLELIGHHLVSIVTGGLATVGIWKFADWVWEWLKPIQAFTSFAEEKMERFGRRTKLFLERRVKNEELRKKIIRDLTQASEKMREAYLNGLD